MTGGAGFRTLAAMDALAFRGRLLAAVLAVVAVGGAFQSASAQTPPAAAGTPSPPVPAGTPWPAPTDAALPGPSQLPLCPSAFNLVSFPVDRTARPRLEATWVEGQRALLLDWNTGPGANCAFFQVQDHAGGYSGVGEMAWADFITGSGVSARLRPAVTTGRQCFRLFTISSRGRSEPVETCAEVPPGAVRTPPPPGSGTPPASGTPWPPPAGARLEGHVLLLDENSFPLPPSQQAWFAGISWDVLPGFTGRFEIQRAQVRRGEPLLWSSLSSGQVPVGLAASGRISIEEWVATGSTWCFRVRSVVEAPAGIETGPFSQEVCQQLPPSSGGNGPPPATPVAPAPLPPDTGNTSRAPRGPGWPGAAAVGVAAALVASGVVARRRR